jgi:hypothetical protein
LSGSVPLQCERQCLLFDLPPGNSHSNLQCRRPYSTDCYLYTECRHSHLDQPHDIGKYLCKASGASISYLAARHLLARVSNQRLLLFRYTLSTCHDDHHDHNLYQSSLDDRKSLLAKLDSMTISYFVSKLLQPPPQQSPSMRRYNATFQVAIVDQLSELQQIKPSMRTSTLPTAEAPQAARLSNSARTAPDSARSMTAI